MKWIADKITGHPWAIIVTCIIVTAVAGYKATRIRINFSIRALWDYKANPDAPAFKRYLDEFGDEGGVVAIILESDRIFSAPVLRYIQDLSREMGRSPIFRRVRSLAVTSVPRGVGDEIVTDALFDGVPTGPSELENLRKVALGNGIAVPSLVSRDGRLAVVAAEMRTPVPEATLDEQQGAVDFAKRLVQVKKPPDGVVLHIGGTPVIETEIRRIMYAEQILFSSLAIVLIVLALLLFFRTAHGIVLPLMVVAVTITWVFGFMVVTGGEMTVVSNTLPTILIVYGVLDAIFLVTRYYDLIDEGRDRRDAARTALIQLGPPCFLNSSATAFGFGSFVLVILPVLRDFGIYMALGVMISFLNSVVLLPAILVVVPPPRKAFRKRDVIRVASGIMDRIDRLVKRRRWAIVWVSAGVLVVTSVVVLQLSRLSVFYLKELPQKSPGVIANTTIEKLGGVMKTTVIVNGPPGSMLEPETIAAIDQLDQYAEKQSVVRASLSLADVVRSMNQAFNGGDPKYFTIPKSRSLVSQYLSILDPDTRADFVNADYSRSQLRTSTSDCGSWELDKYTAGLTKEANRLLGRYRLEYSGNYLVQLAAHERATKSVLWSFCTAFLTIVGMIGLAFRSIRLAVLSIVPNLIPITVCLGIIALLGVSLRLTTTLFLGVAVGLGFNNTIQLFAAMRYARATRCTMDEGLQHILKYAGPPIIFTTLLVACGFGLFALSSFEMLWVLGLSCLGIILVAGAADLLLTTSLMKLAGEPAFPLRKPDPPAGKQ